jgi:hypothetical protein
MTNKVAKFFAVVLRIDHGSGPVYSKIQGIGQTRNLALIK